MSKGSFTAGVTTIALAIRNKCSSSQGMPRRGGGCPIICESFEKAVPRYNRRCETGKPLFTAKCLIQREVYFTSVRALGATARVF